MSERQRANQESEDIQELSGLGQVHAASITKFLWGVASTLMAAWVIASLTFAWRVNEHCVEFRQAIAAIEESDDHLAADVVQLRQRVDRYPPPEDLTGLRLEVSQLQFASGATTQVVNDLTRTVKDLHPWPVQQRHQDPPPQKR